MNGRDKAKAASIDVEAVAFIVHATDPGEDHEVPGWCSGSEWCAGVTFHQQKRAEAFVARLSEPVEP